ncbi:MAG: hypothetical protein H6510_09625 [Acidobacteria bacterium]|nr:hypothetical protein [Acidobacteriota bacterium]
MTLVFWMICGILLIVFYRANQAQMTAFIQFFGLEMTIVQLWFISLLSSVFVCFFYFGIKRMGDRKKIRLFQEDKRAFKELGQSLLSVQNLMALGEFGKARVALNSLPLEASYKAYLQAQCLQGQGNLSEALKSLKEAWDLGSDLAGFELVEALLKTGKEDQATKILDFMLEKNPEAVRPRKLRIDLAERKSQWERALELLEPFADQDPAFYQEKQPALLYEHLMSHFKLSKLGRKDMDDLQKLQKDHPQFIPALLLQSEVYFEQGDERRALRTLEKGFETTGHPEFLSRLELYYLEQGRPEDVLQIYRQMLAKNDDPVVRFQTGRLYKKLEMTDESLNILEPLVKQYEGFTQLGLLVADGKARRLKYEEAYKILRNAVDPKAENTASLQCRSCQTYHVKWSARCNQCKQWNQLDSAIRLLKEKEPDHNPIYY